MARYTHHCALRWSDLDAYGHVNNARFLTLYEEARVALFFVHARGCGLTSFQEGVVIARHEVDYLRPLGYGADQPSQVRIEMWVEDIRAARFTISYELFCGQPAGFWHASSGSGQSLGGVLASRARSVAVPFDLARQRPRRLSDAERAFLGPWQG